MSHETFDGVSVPLSKGGTPSAESGNGNTPRICPFTFMEEEATECVKSTCHWWIVEAGRCAMVVLAQSLAAIAKKGGT